MLFRHDRTRSGVGAVHRNCQARALWAWAVICARIIRNSLHRRFHRRPVRHEMWRKCAGDRWSPHRRNSNNTEASSLVSKISKRVVCNRWHYKNAHRRSTEFEMADRINIAKRSIPSGVRMTISSAKSLPFAHNPPSISCCRAVRCGV